MRTLAEKLQRLTPRDPNQIALLGFMVGVLYSLAGFYLDSALMRLAALNERIDTYLGKKEWCIPVLENPLRSEPQENNRYRFWGVCPELGGRYLRVVTLGDKVTIHNAFPDRGFKP